MKKIILIMLLIISSLGLTSCGVKAKELKVSGATADQNDVLNALDKYEKYFKKTDPKNQWYSIKMSNHHETSKEETEIEVTGVYYHSRFEYDKLIKLNISVSIETEISDDEEVKTEYDIKYIYKDGKSYCKVKTNYESEEVTSSGVEYTDSNSYVSNVLSAIENAFSSNAYNLLMSYSKIYTTENGFAAQSTLGKSIFQMVYSYDAKTYEVKEYSTYSYDKTTTAESVNYCQIKTKLFGVVTEPLHADKY